MKKKRLTIVFLCALFLLGGLSIPTLDADAGACSRTPHFCNPR